MYRPLIKNLNTTAQKIVLPLLVHEGKKSSRTSQEKNDFQWGECKSDAHLTAGDLSHGGPVDEVVYSAQVHRVDGMEVPQHIQGLDVVVALHDGNERPSSTAREPDVGQGLQVTACHFVRSWSWHHHSMR